MSENSKDKKEVETEKNAQETTTIPQTDFPFSSILSTAYGYIAKCPIKPMTSQEWTEAFNSDKYDDGDLRRSILIRTFKAFDEGKYFLEDGKEIALDKKIVYSSIANTQRYEFDDIFAVVKKDIVVEATATPTKVSVENIDSVLGAQKLAKKGLKPMLLNFANAFVPGGAYYYATGTQEENLCLRGALAHTIDNSTRKREFYPIPRNGLLYSPNTYFICGQENEGYPLFDTPLLCDVITSAAIAGPRLYRDGSAAHLKRTPMEDMFRRILIILYVAQQQGCDGLVLGAYGCGAFGNPSSDISMLFHLAIHKYFRGVFKEIIFAILNFNGKFTSTNPINPKGNFVPFEECFKTALSVEELDKFESSISKRPDDGK